MRLYYLKSKLGLIWKEHKGSALLGNTIEHLATGLLRRKIIYTGGISPLSTSPLTPLI
jgi:hypothetical protein